MTRVARDVPSASDAGVMQPDSGPGPVARRAEVWVLAATILGSSMTFIDGTVVNVALPTVQRTFHATSADLQWVIEAYSLFLSALILVGGSLGDRLGRRRVFAFGIVLFTIASIGCGAAPGIGVLIAARSLQGVGGACLVPGSLAIISAAFDPSRRGKAIGTWAGFTTITTALGPVLGGALVQHASWRWVFFINAPLAAIALFLVYRFVPESRDDEQSGRLDWFGALCITGGLGGIVFGLIEAGPFGFGDSIVLASLTAGVVLVVVFVFVEARAAAPMMPLDVFRSRTFTGTNLLTLLLYGGLGGSLYFFPFDLQQVQGYSPTAAGAAFLPFTLIVFLLSRWTGGLVQRYGAKLPLIVGPIITAIGFFLFAVPDIGGSYWTTFFPGVVVMSLGMAVVIAPLTTTVMNAVETHRSGVASGVNNAVSRAAGLLAIAVLGLVVASTFNAELDHRLSGLQVSPPVRRAVEAQRAKLAGASVPPHLSAAERARLEHALKESFVSGFRASMIGAGILAVLSALLAAWLIEGKKIEPHPEPQVA